VIAALLTLAAAAFAAQGPERPVPYLWASAPTPQGWELVHDHVWRPRGRSGGPAIDVLFKEGGSVTDWIHGEAEPSAANLKMQRLSGARAGAVDHRGPWTLVEVEQTALDGKKTKSLSAAMPAPGGIYTVAYWGSEPDYSASRPLALGFLDGFKRMPPLLRYAPVEAAGKFSVSVPTAPWSVVAGDVDADVRVIAPGSPAGGPPGMLTVHALGADKDAASKFLAQTCGGAPTKAVRARAGDWRVAEVLNKGKLTVPEKPWLSDSERRSRCAALTAGGRAYGVWWYAPPSAFDYGLPAFDRALETFRAAP
jgi:hypothetical protein